MDTEVFSSLNPSPTLGSRLRELLALLPGTGILITIDEVQDADPANLSALTVTASDSGQPFNDAGAHTAVSIAHGYRYLVQLAGYLAWNQSEGTITADHVEAVHQEAVEAMGSQFHASSITGVPPAQRSYLHAMADLMDGGSEVVSTAVAEAVGKKPNEATDTRAKLLDRGLIEAPCPTWLIFYAPMGA